MADHPGKLFKHMLAKVSPHLQHSLQTPMAMQMNMTLNMIGELQLMIQRVTLINRFFPLLQKAKTFLMSQMILQQHHIIALS